MENLELDCGSIPLTEKKRIKKEVELVIKFPRTRLSDCTRLMFLPGDDNGWKDIDFDDMISPIYPLPKLNRKEYIFNIGYPFTEVKSVVIPILDEMKTINHLVRAIWYFIQSQSSSSEFQERLENIYLWGICLKKDGTAWIEMETLK